MKYLIVWLLSVTVLLAGCGSNLWEVIECINPETWNKRTEKVLWETNKRLLVERDDDGTSPYLLDKQKRNTWNNCSTTTEEIPPTMLSWYEALSGAFD